MAYVPPHLRGKKDISNREQQLKGGRWDETPPTSYGGPRREGDYERNSHFNRQRERGYGPTSMGGGGYGREPPSRDYGKPPLFQSRGEPEVAAVFADWKPSKRVEDLSEDQIKEIRGRLNLSVETEEGCPPSPPPIESFEDMNLSRNIMVDIRKHEYLKPTAIQAQAIPIALSGTDILGCAETGSGKTASFAIPMISHCANQPALMRGEGPNALVLAPTRELAQQIEQESRMFSTASKIKTCIVVGGASMQEQRTVLRSGVQVVVATPGRYLDHLQQGNSSLNKVSYVVLDEADRMLDMGFEPQIREILTKLPKRHQTLLFSATMPEEIEALAIEYLNKPVRVKVGAVSRPTANVVQHLQKTTEADKVSALVELLLQEKLMTERVAGEGAKLPMTVIFVETKAKCDDITSALNENNMSAVRLHGGRDQREREYALIQFRRGQAQILVATDIASRGLDVSGIAHVINMDLPRQFEDYVHRIGRTGRAGASGRATSFYTDRDSYVVAQIKHAIAQLEKGNDLVFATGKAARAREREAAQAFKTGSAASKDSENSVPLKLDDKLKFMTISQEPTAGASSAWDD